MNKRNRLVALTVALTLIFVMLFSACHILYIGDTVFYGTKAGYLASDVKKAFGAKGGER